MYVDRLLDFWVWTMVLMLIGVISMAFGVPMWITMASLVPATATTPVVLFVVCFMAYKGR